MVTPDIVEKAYRTADTLVRTRLVGQWEFGTGKIVYS